MLLRHFDDAGNVGPAGGLQTLASLRKLAYLHLAENPSNAISKQHQLVDVKLYSKQYYYSQWLGDLDRHPK